MTCLCHTSDLKKLPLIKLISKNEGISVYIRPKQYLSSPYLDIEDPYNPRCSLAVRESDQVVIPKQIYE